MAKCKSGKCGCRARIVSNMVQNLQNNGSNNCSCNSDSCCLDVCVNPICGTPTLLSIMAPVIYDEIGINLCASFALGTDIATTYPTAVSAAAKVINISYTDGDGGVSIEAIAGRPNCYVVTLAGLTVTFAVSLYDENCRLVGTVYPTAAYLPADTEATYDEDTNPSSVELEIFAPYGVSYEIETPPTTGTPSPVLNYVGFEQTNNYVRQGLNLYGIAKALNFELDDNTITVGLTLVLQSLYFSGYRMENAGRSNTPKGSIITPDNSDCMKFVAGDLLDLAIKPLELGPSKYEERYKESCAAGCGCAGGASDNTVTLPLTTPTTTTTPTDTPTTDDTTTT
ncbi:MAG: hypothetical protein NC251_05795 [Lachnoclostridium sp.]|nr:hypothetical protein [Lachnospira sp.]MCM1247925.1 hypothetical protein [Lachnoclostridium sp.]MCM1535702.1 hypothetical protein [Clostridium sp.]